MGGMRRWIAAALLALAAAGAAAGAAGCGSADNGGVIEGPTTTAGAPAATRGSDYSG